MTKYPNSWLLAAAYAKVQWLKKHNGSPQEIKEFEALWEQLEAERNQRIKDRRTQ